MSCQPLATSRAGHQTQRCSGLNDTRGAPVRTLMTPAGERFRALLIQRNAMHPARSRDPPLE